jgi:hypothetical protein
VRAAGFFGDAITPRGSIPTRTAPAGKPAIHSPGARRIGQQRHPLTSLLAAVAHVEDKETTADPTHGPDHALRLLGAELVENMADQGHGDDEVVGRQLRYQRRACLREHVAHVDLAGSDARTGGDEEAPGIPLDPEAGTGEHPGRCPHEIPFGRGEIDKAECEEGRRVLGE